MNEFDHLVVNQHIFSSQILSELGDFSFSNNLWPVVYLLRNDKLNEAYIGETTDLEARMSNHLASSAKNDFKKIHIIASTKFNKSATLDIESNLIKYIAGDGRFLLRNANIGLANHTYYKKDFYWEAFKNIWSKFQKEGLVQRSIAEIDNSDLFKYSPYKSLTVEQKEGLITIIRNILDGNERTIIIEGGAGTGKTILAVYLFKLLHTDIDHFNFKEFGDEEAGFISLVRQLKSKFKNPKSALVVPMSSFRSTIKKVFRHVKGLSPRMVIGPAELVRSKFDIVLVDESHRLRRRANLGTYFGTFDKVCRTLGLEKEKCSELDWVLRQSRVKVLFYDKSQSIKPSDAKQEDFEKLKIRPGTKVEKLKSQFRVKGGQDYVKYVHRLLSCEIRSNEEPFRSKKYEFVMFDSIDSMIEEIRDKNEEFGLSRLVAGYSWKWVSRDGRKTHDIQIEKTKLRWNSSSDDWVNSANAIDEVGCIHTTQGYDLNYTGVIFGNEIGYDKEKDEIVVKKDNYFDVNGKNSISDPSELKKYVINIYNTIMLRGIRGTYVYVCDKDLREYFAERIGKPK